MNPKINFSFSRQPFGNKIKVRFLKMKMREEKGTYGVESVGLGAVISSQEEIGSSDSGSHGRPPHQPFGF